MPLRRSSRQEKVRDRDIFDVAGDVTAAGSPPDDRRASEQGQHQQKPEPEPEQEPKKQQDQPDAAAQRDSKTSAYRGVVWDKRYQRWRARFTEGGTILHIGNFDTEADAALAYDRTAIEKLGARATLNFPTLDDDATNVARASGRERVERPVQNNANVGEFDNPLVQVGSFKRRNKLRTEGGSLSMGCDSSTSLSNSSSERTSTTFAPPTSPTVLSSSQQQQPWWCCCFVSQERARTQVGSGPKTANTNDDGGTLAMQAMHAMELMEPAADPDDGTDIGTGNGQLASSKCDLDMEDVSEV